MKKLLITLAALAMSSQVSASVICAGCEYQEGAAGTFLGVFNSLTGDIATFQNSDVTRADPFQNFWVFDVGPQAVVSIAAGFTFLAALGDFFGELYADDGSACGAVACSSIALGGLVDDASAAAKTWEIIDFLPAGRYVLRIGGSPNSRNNGAYGVQMSFLGISIPIREPGTLGLLAAGVLLLGVGVWRTRRRP